MARKRARQSPSRPPASEVARGPAAAAVLAPAAPPSPPSGTAAPARRFGDRLLITLFLLFLVAPGLGLLLRHPRLRVSLEDPVPPPTVTWDRNSLRTWPARFHSYFTLRLGFRARLLRYHSLLCLKVFQVSPFPDRVIVGTDGWLYLASDNSLKSLLRKPPFSDSQLTAWRDVLERRRDWLEARGSKFLFVICPDKHTIYPEHLPAALQPPRSPSRLDALTAYLQRTSDVAVLDLRPTLLEEKRRHQVYYPLDTHWNELGAFFGYRRICVALRSWYPNVPVPELDQYQVARAPLRPNDLPQMLGLLPADLPGDWVSVLPRLPDQVRFVYNTADQHANVPAPDDTVITERKGAPLRRIVVIRDSFTMMLLPLLAELSDRAVFRWTDDLEQTTIAREHPDLVIWEVVERRLQRPPPSE